MTLMGGLNNFLYHGPPSNIRREILLLRRIHWFSSLLYAGGKESLNIIVNDSHHPFFLLYSHSIEGEFVNIKKVRVDTGFVT